MELLNSVIAGKTLLSTARKEKSRFNSNGLGEVPCVCCNWAGWLLFLPKILYGLVNTNAPLSSPLPLLGQGTVIGSLSVAKADIKVIFAILSAVGSYCVKTYLS